MVVVGGMNTMWGALLGAVSLAVLPELLRVLGSFSPSLNTSDLEMALYGIILILVMIFTQSQKIKQALSHLIIKERNAPVV